MTTTPTTGDPMTTTDHQQAAKKLAQELDGLHLRSSFDLTEGAWRGLRALIAIVASIPATQQPQERPEPAPEEDGTTDPVSGPETGAQRFKAGDRVRVRELLGVGTVLEAGADGYCEIRRDDGGRVSTTHVSWLEPLPGPFDPPVVEPTPDWFRRTVEEFVARRDEYVRVLKQCVETDADYWRWQGHAAARRQLAESLKTARPDDDPTPAPVVLPTTPGSVAWTRAGSVHGLTDDGDDRPWVALGGPTTDGYASAAELIDIGVHRVFDAGTGEAREFDAGTVA